MSALKDATTFQLMDELLQRFAQGQNAGPMSKACFQLMRATEKTWSGLPEAAQPLIAEALKGLKGTTRQAKVKPMSDHEAALRRAFGLSYDRGPRLGCGRVYLCFEDKDAKAIRAAAKKMGKIFQTRSHYGDRHALYIGYDNADGLAIGQARGMIAQLALAGIKATESLHGD